MFENLSTKLQNIFKQLSGKGRLSEADVDTALREVRLALLEADVNFRGVKDFVARVRERAIGADVMKSLTPAQMVIKIVHEELIATLGGTAIYNGVAPRGASVPYVVFSLASGIEAETIVEIIDQVDAVTQAVLDDRHGQVTEKTQQSLLGDPFQSHAWSFAAGDADRPCRIRPGAPVDIPPTTGSGLPLCASTPDADVQSRARHAELPAAARGRGSARRSRCSDPRPT